jgi:hypothetical protein
MPAPWPLKIREAAQAVCDGTHTDTEVTQMAHAFTEADVPAPGVQRRHADGRTIVRSGGADPAGLAVQPLSLSGRPHVAPMSHIFISYATRDGRDVWLVDLKSAAVPAGSAHVT